MDHAARRSVLRRRTPDGTPRAASGADEALADANRLIDKQGAAWLDEQMAALPDDIAHLLQAGPHDLLDAVTHLRASALATRGDLALAARTATADGDLRRAGDLGRWLHAIRAGVSRRSIAHGFAVVERLHEALSLRWPDAPPLEPMGSLRRFEPVIGDVDILVESPDPDSTMRHILSSLGIADSLLLTPTHALFLDGDRQVSLRAVAPDVAPAARVCLTGSTAHLALLDARARERGMVIRGDGVARIGSHARIPVASERELYALLDAPWVEPERRHGDPGDFDDDTTGDALIDVADIRGDLHTHTIWSDGRDAVDAIAYAARALGYEYVAISDHSERANASRTLTRDRIARQADDIARVRRLVPEVEILHGIEVDIMPDGSLDFPDAVLERFDIVLASLHEPNGHAPAELLARYERAMRHPLVHVITHPANRVPGATPGYDLDYDTFFAIAVATGTVVEIDGGPHHLDLDGLLARRAVAMGVRLSIDSDCHSAARLGRQMRLGVGTARRGAIRPRHVVNTLGRDALHAWLSGKRPGYGR